MQLESELQSLLSPNQILIYYGLKSHFLVNNVVKYKII